MRMFPHGAEIENIKNQIIAKYSPEKIILFGSCAKGRIKKSSDIDLCIILDVEDKRKTVQDMLLNLDYNLDLDIVLFTPKEWEQYKGNQATFAGIINRTGVCLYG